MVHRLSRSTLTPFVDVAVAAGDFAQTVADLAACDVGKQLSLSLSGLAEVERKAQELQSSQANDDVITILSTGPSTFSYSLCNIKLKQSIHSGRVHTPNQFRQGMPSPALP